MLPVAVPTLILKSMYAKINLVIVAKVLILD